MYHFLGRIVICVYISLALSPPPSPSPALLFRPRPYSRFLSVALSFACTTPPLSLSVQFTHSHARINLLYHIVFVQAYCKLLQNLLGKNRAGLRCIVTMESAQNVGVLQHALLLVNQILVDKTSKEAIGFVQAQVIFLTDEIRSHKDVTLDEWKGVPEMLLPVQPCQIGSINGNYRSHFVLALFDAQDTVADWCGGLCYSSTCRLAQCTKAFKGIYECLGKPVPLAVARAAAEAAHPSPRAVGGHKATSKDTKLRTDAGGNPPVFGAFSATGFAPRRGSRSRAKSKRLYTAATRAYDDSDEIAGRGDDASHEAKGTKLSKKPRKGRAKTETRDDEGEGADTQAAAVGGAAVTTTPVALVDLTTESDADEEKQKGVSDDRDGAPHAQGDAPTATSQCMHAMQDVKDTSVSGGVDSAGNDAGRSAAGSPAPSFKSTRRKGGAVRWGEGFGIQTRNYAPGVGKSDSDDGMEGNSGGDVVPRFVGFGGKAFGILASDFDDAVAASAKYAADQKQDKTNSDSDKEEDQVESQPDGKRT